MADVDIGESDQMEIEGGPIHLRHFGVTRMHFLGDPADTKLERVDRSAAPALTSRPRAAIPLRVGWFRRIEPRTLVG
jgi:hypothetical protein